MRTMTVGQMRIMHGGVSGIIFPVVICIGIFFSIHPGILIVLFTALCLINVYIDSAWIYAGSQASVIVGGVVLSYIEQPLYINKKSLPGGITIAYLEGEINTFGELTVFNTVRVGGAMTILDVRITSAQSKRGVYYLNFKGNNTKAKEYVYEILAQFCLEQEVEGGIFWPRSSVSIGTHSWLSDALIPKLHEFLEIELQEVGMKVNSLEITRKDLGNVLIRRGGV